jgi:hypothetical protein
MPTEERTPLNEATAPAFLPELHENDAPPEIRAIYQEIRHLTGVPMVALIWRHLATVPGVLPDAWSSLAPVLRSGLLQETAWQIAGDARIPSLDALTPADLKVMSVDSHAQDSIATVLEAYNRANPVNMLCVYTLLARLVRPDGQALAPDVVLWEPPTAIARLPRMYAQNEMTPEQRGRLEGLSSPEAMGGAPTIPSLYRHLVPWPDYMAWLEAGLRPWIDDGRLVASVTSIRTGMAREAEGLVVHVPPALALQAHPEVKIALTRFSSLIPQMIVVGRLLREALP